MPSPAGKVDRRIAETDEEVTYLQIPMLLKIFRKNWTLQKSDLLIHRSGPPSPLGKALTRPPSVRDGVGVSIIQPSPVRRIRI